MTDRQERDMVDDAIIDQLYHIDNPHDGRTVREMTRAIYGYGDNETSTTEQFYTRAKLVERRIGACRQRIFSRVRREMEENGGSTKVKRPAFIPYALQDGHYWKYFNAANFEQMPWIILGLRHKADGLNSNAEVLEAIF